MNDHRQAELLEQYLISLRRDPNATPPDDLDPVMAELARKFKQQPVSRPNSAVKARIWQRTMAASRNQAQFSTYSLDRIRQEAEAKEVRPRRVVYPVTLSVAVIAVTLFFAAMLIFGGNAPGNNPSLAGSPDATNQPVEDMQTAAVSTPTSTGDVAAQFADPVVTTRIGMVQTGMLSPDQPMMVYQFEVTENGIGVARVETTEFIPALYYSVRLSSLQSTSSSPAEPMSIPGFPTRVFSSANGENILFISRNPNPIWFPATKGDVVQVHVTSTTPGEWGNFRLITRWLPPVMITMSQPQTFSFSPASPFAYYTFRGQPGERLRLDINGEQARQAFFFSAERPLLFDVLKRAADAYPPLIPSTAGEYGMVVGPDDIESTGSFSIKLEAENQP
jgi:hypothetical protein